MSPEIPKLSSAATLYVHAEFRTGEGLGSERPMQVSALAVRAGAIACRLRGSASFISLLNGPEVGPRNVGELRKWHRLLRPWIVLHCHLSGNLGQHRGMPICGHSRVTGDLSGRVLCHHKLARTGQLRRIRIDMNRIDYVDCFQVRRDRGVGGKAKAKSITSLNERAQWCWPSKDVLSLASNDRFEAPRRDA
jgi:hypothetical protein